MSVASSKRAVFVALSGACTHESGVSMAGVVHRALNDANVSCSVAWFASNDDAFFPECETQDDEWCASIEHDIKEAGGSVLQCDTISLAQCRQEARIVERYGARQPPSEVVRVRPTGKDGGVLLVLWRHVPKDEALALDVVRQVAARHPRNDLTPITLPVQVYWPTRKYFGGADDDVLYINVEDTPLGEADCSLSPRGASVCR